MRRSALRRAVGAWAVISTAALLFGSGVVGNTFASFSAATTNSGSTFADGWLGAPTGGSATPQGYDVKLGWTPTTTGPIGGHQVWGVDNGTSSNCTGAAYGNLNASGLTATSTQWVDSNRGSGSANGDWYCYEVLSAGDATAPNWSTPEALSSVQLGLVLQSVAVSGNNGGSVNKGDKIVLTFNQAPASVGTPTVCVFKSPSVILIGDTHAGGCSSGSSDPYSIGALTPSSSITWNGGATSQSFTTTTAISGNVLTITLAGKATATVATSASYTWGQPTTATVKSSYATDQATVCATTAATCLPTPSVTTAF